MRLQHDAHRRLASTRKDAFPSLSRRLGAEGSDTFTKDRPCARCRPGKSSGKGFQCQARFVRGLAGSLAVERTSEKNKFSLLFSVY